MTAEGDHSSAWRRSWQPTRSEILLGLLYAALSCAIVAALLSTGRELTGGENQVAADQLQYLSWIVSSAKHGTINNLWTIPAQGSSHFVEPGFFVSGLLHRAGLGVIPSYQLWKLVSIPLLVIAFAAYVRRLLPPGGARAAGLALALFGLSPVGALVGWGSLHGGWRAQIEFAAGEMFAPGWMWGYMMTGVAVALVPLVLLGSARALTTDLWKRWTALACAGAFLCSWLQPWQGAEIVGAVLACSVLAPGRPSLRVVASRHSLIVVSGMIPLVYYRWLASTDRFWELAGQANNSIPHWSPWVWIAAMGPFVVALPALLKKPADWQETALRAVPVIMLAEYAVIAAFGVGTFAFHAIQGIVLFLAILAVQSALIWRDAPWWGRHRWLAIGLCAIMCIPGAAHRLNLMRLEIHRSAQPYFFEDGERQAVEQLATAAGPGGVLAPIKAGLSVPGWSGRPVWVGQISWTHDYRRRVADAEALFKGRLDRTSARRLVLGSGARFLYSDCGHPFDLRSQLDGLIVGVTDHGCARIYELAMTR